MEASPRNDDRQFSRILFGFLRTHAMLSLGALVCGVCAKFYLGIDAIDLGGMVAGSFFGFFSLLLYGEISRVVLGGTPRAPRGTVGIIGKIVTIALSFRSVYSLDVAWLFSALLCYLLIFPAAIIGWNATLETSAE